MTEQPPNPGAGKALRGGRFTTWQQFLPVAGPLVVLLIAITLFDFVNGEELPASYLRLTPAGSPEHLTAELRARLLWEASVVLLIVAALAGMAIGLSTVLRCGATHQRRQLLIAMSLLSLFSVIMAVWSDPSFLYVRTGLLEPTLGQLAKTTPAALFDLDDFRLSRQISNGLTGIATVCIAFGIVACVTGAPAVGSSGESAAQHLANRMHILATLLYFGTAVLVGVVLTMVAWLEWPAALLDEAIERQQVDALALGLGVFWGTTFTLMLVAAYLPAALALRAEAAALAATVVPEVSPAERVAWIEEHGLTLPVRARLVRMAALLGPVVTGFLPVISALT